MGRTSAAQKQKAQVSAYFTPTGFQIEYDLEEKGRTGEKPVFAEWISRFQKDRYEALYHLGFQAKESWFAAPLLFLYQISDAVIRKLTRQPDLEFTREETIVEPSSEEIQIWMESVPYAVGMEFVDERWLEALWGQLLEAFRKEIASYQGTASMYFAECNSNMNVAGRVFFHLVESKKEERYPFAFMATYSTKPVKSKKAVHTPLKNALKEFKGDDTQLLKLLASVTRAAENSAMISDLMESGELFLPLRFTAEDAYCFLREIPIYEEAGIMCRVPDWWRKKNYSVGLTVSVGEKKPSVIGLDAIMDFSPVLTVDGEKITLKELKEFLEMADGLVQYKGKWIEINQEKLRAALEAFDRVRELSKKGQVSLAEAMRMELSPEKSLGTLSQDIEVQITNGRWLRNLTAQMKNPVKLRQIQPVDSFHAVLRGYQEEGFSWLYAMSQMGFGACLADDMGLGKTVQIIALLEYYRVEQGGKALLVLPASLIGNWEKEIVKFAPEMPVKVLHSSAKADLSGSDWQSPDWRPDEGHFLYITTYGMVSRLSALPQIRWDFLILDEAQAIKNAGTKQSKCVKAIPANCRIAMTGTPIENRLGDLWSLFDFLNKGLLGSAKEFTAFSKKLAEGNQGYARLKRMVNPFILRRLKTDKSIIADLPDKIEMKEYAALTKKQIGLYQKLVADIGRKLADMEEDGIERKGLILSSIMKFKQICNHPDQYLGREEFKETQSGKFERLREICETIYEKRERVLVFTQFREMAEPLSALLTEVFHKEGLVLHGGTSVKKRNEMVERFNGEEYVPYMVLSLKAGGVGLNLTSANHVVHFDRWWNPAVENQATDRAFRIGQTRNVMVYKFVTQGTIEEKIDQMLEEKQRLASDILSASSGEAWITEMDNKQLMELFSL